MAETQPNSRLETFCDGVFAIALTLLIIDIKIVIYNAVTAIQGIGWILVSGAALRGGLTKDEKSTRAMRDSHRNGYVALVAYSLLAIVALWLPLGIAIVTTISWAYWLIYGINMKSD